MRQQLVVPALIAGILVLGSWFLSRDRGGDTVPVELAPNQARGAAQAGANTEKSSLAPDFSLQEVMSGDMVKLSGYRGKVVLVDFWATWCRPCRMEIPHFVDLKKELPEKDFEIIGVSVDRNGKAVVVPFVKDWNINYPTVIDTGSVSAAYGGIRSIPTAFLIGRDGSILQTFVGYRPKEVFEQAIRQAIEKS